MKIDAFIIIFMFAMLVIFVSYIISVYNELLNSKLKIYDKFEKIDNIIDDIKLLLNDISLYFKRNIKHEEKLESELDELIKHFNARKINNKIDAINEYYTFIDKFISLSNIYHNFNKDKEFINIKNKIENLNDSIDYAKEFYNNEIYNYNILRNSNMYKVIGNIFKFDIYKKL